MRKHDVAEGIAQEHELISKLPQFLKRQGLAERTIEYLKRSIFFAYPGTLWLKLSVDPDEVRAPNSINYRHSLNPDETGKALNAWFLKNPAMHNVVFDLRGITIFDLTSMVALFERVGLETMEKFWVCQGEIESILRNHSEIGKDHVFSSEREMICRLRDIPGNRRCRIILPKFVDLISLDDALQIQAPPSKLKHFDAIAFDFADVVSLSFQAHSMISPIIHSIAHKHGILATIVNLSRSKVENDLVNHGSFRVMRSNFIQTPQEYFRQIDSLDPELVPDSTLQPNALPDVGRSILSMRAFGSDDANPIKQLCSRRLNVILHEHKWWFREVAGISRGATPSQMSRVPQYYMDLLRVVDELIDNAAYHSHGLGYLMIELNPEPKRGLSIYVGDTGIGLARGIQRTYKKRIKGDLEAVGIALRLADYLPERRRLRGTSAFGGRGLEHVRILLKRLSATAWIRSGTAMAEFTPHQGQEPLKIYSKLYNVQGTHIHINIPTRWEAIS